MTTAVNTKQSEKELVIVREFEAPRDLVWDVWTEPSHIEKWFGPQGFATKVKGIDFKVGGLWQCVMIGPDGTEYPAKGVFKEITPKSRIVTTDEFGDGYVEAHPEMDLPKGIVSTAQFDDLGTRTRLTLTISHPTIEDRKKNEDMGVVDGWNSSLDKMVEYLAETQK